MKVGDLFSGIGGFSLAARWIGWETIWFSEIDPYASRVLEKHWPDVPNLGDITKIDWSHVERPDILCGGFPCQDISNAGKRAGITGERSGLWREFARAIRELRPRYVVVENVAALLGRGLDRVLGDLAELGYDAEWTVLSAADVGAPHLRERIWILGYERLTAQSAVSDARGDALRLQRERHGEQRHVSRSTESRADGGAGPLADSDSSGSAFGGEGDAGSERWPRRHAVSSGCAPLAHANATGLEGSGQTWTLPQWEDSNGHTRPSGMGDGRGHWAVEPDVGRLAHGVRARVDRLRGLGNAIVPQCALEIFRAIEASESQDVRAA